VADDPRFATNAARCDNHALLKRLIEAVTLGDTVAFWIARLEGAGLPTARVQDMGQVLRDPQLLARHMVLPVTPRPGGPDFTAPGNPIKISTLPEIDARAPAPALDGDRQAVLDWLDRGHAT
jgi:CoA:oxalate CoA-transferase